MAPWAALRHVAAWGGAAMNRKVNRFSVLVIGGGPAGCVAAGVLARNGAQVTVLEKARHPRSHVGESLQPAAFEYLKRYLDMGDVFAHQGFARKYGAVYVWGETRDPWQVLFDPRLEADLPNLNEQQLLSGGYEHAWNVDRAVFDALIADAARKHGADIHEDVRATDPIMDGDRVVGMCAVDKHGNALRYHADIVLDASGQGTVLGRRFGLTRVAADLRSTATHAYYEGGGGVPGPLGRHVQYVVTVPDGWIWYIPISADVTSVGVVLKEKARMSEERFRRVLAEAELPLDGAKMVPGPHGEGLSFHRDWSFSHAQFTGPGWMLVGDAACFVDPILSGGVDFAIRGACKAADTVLRAFGGRGDETALMQDYEARVRQEFRAYLRLARYWYGNNRSVQGMFWQAHEEIAAGEMYTPARAFVYITSGRYARDRDFPIFDEMQERRMFRALGASGPQIARARRVAHAPG